jgi:ABC-type sugar transport system substrate-binding protein
MEVEVHTRFLLAAAVVLLLALGSTGVAAATRLSLPSPEDLPTNTVAVVSHVAPDFRTVTTAELRRAMAQAAALARLKSLPKSDETGYVDLRNSALGELLERSGSADRPANWG